MRIELSKIKKSSALFFCFMLFFYSNGQIIQNKVDSLDALLKKGKLQNQEKLNAQLMRLKYYKFNPKEIHSADSLRQEIVKLSRTLDDQTSELLADYYYFYTAKKTIPYKESKILFDKLNAKVKKANNEELKNLMLLEKVYLLIFNEGDNASAKEILDYLKNKEVKKHFNSNHYVDYYLGIYYYVTEKRDTAKIYFNNVIKNASDKALVSSNYNNLANIHLTQGSLTKAIEFYYKSLDLNLQLGNISIIPSNYTNLGICYKNLKKYNKAIEYYNKAYKVALQINDKNSQFIAKLNLGNCKMQINENEEALKELLEAKSLAKAKGFKSTWYKVALNRYLANCYINLGQLDKAKVYIDKTNSLSLETKKIPDQDAQSFLAIWYEKNGEHNKALEVVNNTLGRNNIKVATASRLYKVQSRIYEKLGDYKKALASHKNFKKVSDSILNESNIQQITALNMEFEFNQEKKQIEIENEKQKAVQQEKIKQQSRLALVLGLGTVVLLIISGITFYLYRQKKKSSKIIEDKRKKLAQFNKTNSKLLSIIGHDFKTPLTSLSFLTQLLMKENLTQKKSDSYLKMVMNEINTLQISIDNTLYWAHSQFNKFKSNRRVYSIEQIVKYCGKSLQEPITNKGLTMDYQFEKDLEAFVDKDHLIMILRNLISNAIKFSHKNSTIKITTSNANDLCKIVVRDYGIGMPAKKLNELKNAIYSNSSEHGTEGEKGTGIGISICKDLLKENQGTIDFESFPDQGTEVTITIPKANSTASKQVQ